MTEKLPDDRQIHDCHPDYWNSDGDCLICGLSRETCELNAEVRVKHAMNQWLRTRHVDDAERMKQEIMRWYPLMRMNNSLSEE